MKQYGSIIWEFLWRLVISILGAPMMALAVFIATIIEPFFYIPEWKRFICELALGILSAPIMAIAVLGAELAEPFFSLYYDIADLKECKRRNQDIIDIVKVG